MTINNLPDNMLARIKAVPCLTPGLDGMCWQYEKSINGGGYGCVVINKKTYLVHRISYELHNGTIPDGLQIDHLCRNKACCNPHHLEPVTCKENIRRHQAAVSDDRIAASLTLDDFTEDDIPIGRYFEAVQATRITWDPHKALAEHRAMKDAEMARCRKRWQSRQAAA